uniref:PX domain-containing protein n=1 Tax=viral metagenome TaxID=1070528 RepID=A0A6C0L166_9ZZZZ|tara:strand:- start:10929 stop:11588 length:660 start_codon:yes stop_codon:yes gene_type:complete
MTFFESNNTTKSYDWDFFYISSTSGDLNKYSPFFVKIPEWVSFESVEFQILWQDIYSGRDLKDKYNTITKKNIIKKFNDKSSSNNLSESKYTKFTGIMVLRSFKKWGAFGIQITHFRINKDNIPNFAEYLVKLKTNKYEYSTWKRYTDFYNFYSDIVLNNPNLYMKNTKNTWRFIQIWKSWFRNLKTSYIKKKAYLLECLLHDILYEINNPELLINYFT